MNQNHNAATTTTRRRKRKQKVFDLPVFLDQQGRECHHLPTTSGPDVLILKEDFDLISPYLTSGKFFWNDDNKRDEDGELLRHYAKTTARIPGKRGKNKHVTGRPTLSRLIWLAYAKAHRLPEPTHGWEVAYIDLTKRHSMLPENLKVRPRWDNKHYASYLLTRDSAFDPVTGFDPPSTTNSDGCTDVPIKE